MADKISTEFQWVQARAECSPVKVFEQLRMQVAKDVELRNTLGAQKFVILDDGRMFSVFLDSLFHTENPFRVVRFTLEGDKIVARYGNEAVIFSASLTLDKKGECRLKINDTNYELWQARHMALEKLFFEIVKPS